MGHFVSYRDGEQALSGYFAPAASTEEPRSTTVPRGGPAAAAKSAEVPLLSGAAGGGLCAAKKAPGVLIVHAWLGITESIQSRADRIAEAGYHAFAADIFGKPVDIAAGPRPVVSPFRADRKMFRKRVRAGLDALASQAGCDAVNIAAIGYCFGGNAVLELARDGAPVVGIVSFHGELDTPLPAGPGDIKGKILVLTGDADPVVPFEKVAAFRDEMRSAGADWEIDIYSGAKHSFTGEGSLGVEKTPEAVLNPQAEARSWRRMIDFFAESFGHK